MKTHASRIRSLILTALTAAALTACSSNLLPTPGNAPTGAPGASGATAENQTSETVRATAESSGAHTVTEALSSKTQPHDEATAVPTASVSEEIAITLNGDVIAVDSPNVVVSGSRATIGAPGVYRISGALNNGQISVNAKDKGAVRLILSGATISNADGAAIDIVEADTAIITLAENTTNSIADGSSYVFSAPDVDEPNAAIFSKADLTIDGTGALNVQGNFNDGIASKDGLVIANGAITVNAVDDGIRGKDYLVVHDGVITVTAKGDGLKSDDEEDPAKGYVAIGKGSFTLTAGGDAIQAHTDVLISGGVFTLTSGGGSTVSPSDTLSAKGIKSGVNLTIDGGEFKIDASDDALHTNDSMTVNNGRFELTSADDAMHADNTIEINAGVVRILRSYEGIESRVITINGGDVLVTSSDDGINVADGTGGGPGGRPGQQTSTYTGNLYFYMNGGTVTVDAGGDGVDANGAVEMKGGTLLVHGPTASMNAALDYDALFAISGGVVAAAGSSGMAQAPGTNSQQSSVLIFFDARQAAGTLIHVRDSSGAALLTFAPNKDFQTLAFSSPELVKGGSYEVLLGGSADGEAVNGYYGSAIYTPGEVFKTFTIDDVVTIVGTNTNRRMRGPQP